MPPKRDSAVSTQCTSTSQENLASKRPKLQAVDDSKTAHHDGCSQFFREEPEPDDLGTHRDGLAEFVTLHTDAHRRLVMVSSGGTSVPLEKNMVRFLDNFSGGNRGSASVEHFIREGYAVVFLRRRGSAAPFARHFQSALGSRYMDLRFMQSLQMTDQGIGLKVKEDAKVGGSELRRLSNVCAWFEQVTAAGVLYTIEFTSLHQYLHYLKAIATAFAPAGTTAMMFYAAAVSDFYIPSSAMAQHKIQSRAGPLEMKLQQSPKLLGVLRAVAPRALHVSFKLETDSQLLLKKARAACEKYGMDVVVANMLQSRYERVVLVSAHAERTILRPTNPNSVPSPEETEVNESASTGETALAMAGRAALRAGAGACEVERPLIAALAVTHAQHIAEA